MTTSSGEGNGPAEPAQPSFKARFTFRPLLGALLAMLLLQAIGAGRATAFLTAIILSGILLTAVFALHSSRTRQLIALTLLVPGIVLVWLEVGVPGRLVSQLALAMELAFFLYTTGCVLALILAPGPVTGDKLAGTVAVFLLLGILWSSAYRLLESVYPGSFTVPGEELEKNGGYFYFSFVTLTTLGYGDISPVSRPARSLVIMEAICGQFYLAMLVARLVAQYVTTTELEARSDS